MAKHLEKFNLVIVGFVYTFALARFEKKFLDENKNIGLDKKLTCKKDWEKYAKTKVEFHMKRREVIIACFSWGCDVYVPNELYVLEEFSSFLEFIRKVFDCSHTLLNLEDARYSLIQHLDHAKIDKVAEKLLDTNLVEENKWSEKVFAALPPMEDAEDTLTAVEEPSGPVKIAFINIPLGQEMMTRCFKAISGVVVFGSGSDCDVWIPISVLDKKANGVYDFFFPFDPLLIKITTHDHLQINFPINTLLEKALKLKDRFEIIDLRVEAEPMAIEDHLKDDLWFLLDILNREKARINKEKMRQKKKKRVVSAEEPNYKPYTQKYPERWGTS